MLAFGVAPTICEWVVSIRHENNYAMKTTVCLLIVLGGLVRHQMAAAQIRVDNVRLFTDGVTVSNTYLERQVRGPYHESYTYDTVVASLSIASGAPSVLTDSTIVYKESAGVGTTTEFTKDVFIQFDTATRTIRFARASDYTIFHWNSANSDYEDNTAHSLTFSAAPYVISPNKDSLIVRLRASELQSHKYSATIYYDKQYSFSDKRLKLTQIVSIDSSAYVSMIAVGYFPLESNILQVTHSSHSRQPWCRISGNTLSVEGLDDPHQDGRCYDILGRTFVMSTISSEDSCVVYSTAHLQPGTYFIPVTGSTIQFRVP
jgi:hypothetical protein